MKNLASKKISELGFKEALYGFPREFVPTEDLKQWAIAKINQLHFDAEHFMKAGQHELGLALMFVARNYMEDFEITEEVI